MPTGSGGLSASARSTSTTTSPHRVSSRASCATSIPTAPRPTTDPGPPGPGSAAVPPPSHREHGPAGVGRYLQLVENGGKVVQAAGAADVGGHLAVHGQRHELAHLLHGADH